MVKYYFSDSVNLNLTEYADKINFLYHINLFDWPIEHGHADYWEFTIVTAGSIQNCCNGKMKTYNANSVFVATTSDVHRLLSANGEAVRYINIMVKESYLQKTLNAISPELLPYIASDQFELTLSGNKISEIEQILLHINYVNANLYKENEKLTCSAFLLLLSDILLSQTVDSLRGSSYLILLNQLAQNNTLLTFNVNSLSKALGYSRVRLNALFKKNFGVTPHEYLVEYKFNHASRLLVNTTMTISEIAYTIGYSNPMQFYATFKKIYKVTPNQYRKLRHSDLSKNKEENP